MYMYNVYVVSTNVLDITCKSKLVHCSSLQFNFSTSAARSEISSIALSMASCERPGRECGSSQRIKDLRRSSMVCKRLSSIWIIPSQFSSFKDEPANWHSCVTTAGGKERHSKRLSRVNTAHVFDSSWAAVRSSLCEWVKDSCATRSIKLDSAVGDRTCDGS